MAFRALLCLFGLFLCTSALGNRQMLGEVTGISKKDPAIQGLVVDGMATLNKQANNYYQFMPIEVLDASKQVVAGMRYCVVVAVGSSEACPKGQGHSTTDLKECPVTKQEMQCAFSLWEKQWENFREVKLTGCRTEDEVEQKGSLRCSGSNNIKKRHAEEVVEDYQELPKEEEKISAAFNEFMEKYGKGYHDNETEFEYRYGVFKENLELAEMMQKNEQGTAQYGVTQFSDLTKEEFLAKYTMNDWGEPLYEMKAADIPQGSVPESFDWRDHDAVTAVKNQGTCGSCWAFSTTGNIEGQWAIAKKNLISLSEQELVDCDKVDQGCNGGLPSSAYKEIIRLGGLETESEYSYKGSDGKCNFEKQDVVVYINGSVKISSNEDDMAAWLASKGPISIGINALAMQFYMGGVAHPWKLFCNPSELNHGVLIVGYGVKKSTLFGNTPYWIIKNSWGASWGVQGYYLIYRGGGCCGLNTMCTSATVE